VYQIHFENHLLNILLIRNKYKSKIKKKFDYLIVLAWNFYNEIKKIKL